MNLLKRVRRATPAETAVVAEDSGSTLAGSNFAGKGRPTPKRRDAEARRRGPVPPPPTTQREAYKRSKATGGTKMDRKAASAERRERMMSGDDRYVLPRDRGPARALARDVVDARRNLIGLFMPIALLLVLSFLLAPAVESVLSLGVLAYVLVIIVEGLFLGRLVNRRVHERFPDEPAGGFKLGWYAFVRASQLRRLRAPRPRVRPGDAV